MRAFTYERADTPQAAAQAAARTPGAKFIAGGTNLLDLMKLEIETPTHLIDVNRVGLDRIEATEDGGLRIGALVRNTDLAADERLQQARAGVGLRRHSRIQPQPRRDRGQRIVHRAAPLGHGGRPAGARRRGRDRER